MWSRAAGANMLQAFSGLRISGNGNRIREGLPAVSNFICSNASPFLVHKREMSRVKHRHTHPKLQWPLKKRERHDQELTSDNESFLKQVIVDKYGHAPYIAEGSGLPYASPLKEIIQQRGERTERSVRCGVIARKIGVYPMWDKDGERYLTTLLQVVDNHVIKYIPPEIVRRTYGANFGNLGLQIVGAEGADPQVFTKEYCGLFTECGIMPKVKLARFTITQESVLQPGTPLYATHFTVGQYVDVVGKTIERGFQGVMVRWKFHGMPATHGVTKSHRKGGCIGGGGEKGRVWPGTKLPGHMGSLKRPLKGLQIFRINTKYNVIYVKGPNVPGEINSFVTIRDCFMPHRRNIEPFPPFPTYYPDEVNEKLPDDIFYEKMHAYGDPTILHDEKR